MLFLNYILYLEVRLFIPIKHEIYIFAFLIQLNKNRKFPIILCSIEFNFDIFMELT